MSIVSYGLIAYCEVEGDVSFLIHQQRDTYEYCDFIRGLYSESLMFKLFRKLTPTERKRIRYYTFEELWKDFWPDPDKPSIRRRYPFAKNKYDSIKKYISSTIDGTKSLLTEPLYGFPKGKKDGSESDVQTAIREFEEETTILRSYLSVYYAIGPFIEKYKGTNGYDYESHFYIGKCKEKMAFQKIQRSGTIRESYITPETENLQWLSVNDIDGAPISNKKKSILKRVYRVILPSLGK